MTNPPSLHTEPSPLTRSGFISVVGLTNVGKSTLVNALVGAKVSIVSHKVQTTRQRLLGITVYDHTQLIFVDTPGYFTPKKRLDRAMVQAALSAPQDGDVTLMLVDPLTQTQEAHLQFLEKLPRVKHPRILVVNKIDMVPKENLLKVIEHFEKAAQPDHIFLISALKGDGLFELKETLSKLMPEGPYLYPEEQMTDLPVRALAAEITREKIYEHLHQELPYAIHVETESFETFDNGDLKISQVIHVSRPSQKAIVLGKGGGKIKQVGKAARLELSALLDKKVHLKLHVRVTENWTNDPHIYGTMGLDFNA